MKVHVITFAHNEATFLPFFLRHYSWVDKIIVVMGSDTTDDSREICAMFPNVGIENFEFPGGLLDDDVKIEKYNGMVAAQDCDWVLALDTDEFIWPATSEDPREFLARQAGSNLIYATMYQVYRHESEGPLDPSLPAPGQRRHGNPEPHHIKPVIVRPSTGIVWTPGNHHYTPDARIRVSPEIFVGAHWAYADTEIAIARYVHGRKERMSKANIEKRHGWHTFELTKDSIRAECRAHDNDPVVIGEE